MEEEVSFGPDSSLNLKVNEIKALLNRKEILDSVLDKLGKDNPKHYEDLVVPREIDKLIKKITDNNHAHIKMLGAPMRIDDLNNLLTQNDKLQLKAILLPKAANTKELASGKSDIPNQGNNLSGIRGFFGRLFNDRQTQISIEEVEELIHGSKPESRKRRRVQSVYIKQEPAS